MNVSLGQIEAFLTAADLGSFTRAARKLHVSQPTLSLLVRDREFGVFWVADSRCYLLRDGQLHQLSRDHSQVQEMVDRGLLPAEDVEGHPMGHVLARAVGVRDTLQVDAIRDQVEPGDIFLLCSDGLHGYVSEADIHRLLSRADPHESSKELVQLTLDRGAPDNVTVITVMFTEPTLLSIKQPVTVS